MRFSDEEIERRWRALQAAKHERFLHALEIAMQAAWDDIPEEKQTKYLAFALTAVNQEEAVN